MTVRSARESSRIEVSFAIAVGVRTGVRSTGTPACSASSVTSGGGANPPVIRMQGKSSRSAWRSLDVRESESSFSR